MATRHWVLGVLGTIMLSRNVAYQFPITIWTSTCMFSHFLCNYSEENLQCLRR